MRINMEENNNIWQGRKCGGCRGFLRWCKKDDLQIVAINPLAKDLNQEHLQMF